MGRKDRLLRSDIDLGTASLVPLIAIGAEMLFQIVVLAFSLPTNVYTWIVVVGNQIVFFLTCFIFNRCKGISLAELTGVKRVPKPYLFPLFALVALLCVFAFAPVAGLFSSLLRTLGYNYTPQYFVPFDNVGLFILSVLGLGILPAVGEETLMRGVLLSGAKKRSPLFAICFTASVFALFHGNAVQLVHQFLLGAVMAYLVLLTRSVWASATVHCVNNAAALVAEYLFVNGKIGKNVYGYFTADFSAGLTAGAFAGVFIASMILLVAALALVTYLIKCARMHAGTLPENADAKETLRSLLVEADEQPASEKEEGFMRYAPAFLVAVLVILLIANLLSEVLK